METTEYRGACTVRRFPDGEELPGRPWRACVCEFWADGATPRGAADALAEKLAALAAEVKRDADALAELE